MDLIERIKLLIEKLPHSPSRVPFTYHHDFVRSIPKFNLCSRSDISSYRKWTEEELYTAALIQIIEGINTIDCFHYLDYNDLITLRQASEIVKRMTDEIN